MENTHSSNLDYWSDTSHLGSKLVWPPALLFSRRRPLRAAAFSGAGPAWAWVAAGVGISFWLGHSCLRLRQAGSWQGPWSTRHALRGRNTHGTHEGRWVPQVLTRGTSFHPQGNPHGRNQDYSLYTDEAGNRLREARGHKTGGVRWFHSVWPQRQKALSNCHSAPGYRACGCCEDTGGRSILAKTCCRRELHHWFYFIFMNANVDRNNIKRTAVD